MAGPERLRASAVSLTPALAPAVGTFYAEPIRVQFELMAGTS